LIEFEALDIECRVVSHSSVVLILYPRASSCCTPSGSRVLSTDLIELPSESPKEFENQQQQQEEEEEQQQQQQLVLSLLKHLF